MIILFLTVKSMKNVLSVLTEWTNMKLLLLLASCAGLIVLKALIEIIMFLQRVVVNQKEEQLPVFFVYVLPVV